VGPLGHLFSVLADLAGYATEALVARMRRELRMRLNLLALRVARSQALGRRR
jgi:hypothetical protein